MARGSDYTSEARQICSAIWYAVHERDRMQTEWNAGDYTNTLPDGAGDNIDINQAEVGAFVFATLNVFAAVIAGGTIDVIVDGQTVQGQIPPGHATNMQKLLTARP